jgi:hypothetical protein
VGESMPKPIPLKTLPAPIARLLPTLFEYARQTVDPDIDVGPDVKQLFVAHTRALNAFLTAMASDAGPASDTLAPFVSRCEPLASLRGSDLSFTLADLIVDLQAVYKEHHKHLRAAISSNLVVYRDLYRDVMTPKRIQAIFADETWGESESLGTKLTKRCWYDYQGHHENDGLTPLAEIDMVLYAPGQRPIQRNIEEAVAEARVPLLVLAGLGQGTDSPNMAQFRTTHRYRKLGHCVLVGSFVPVRLYQAIDGHYLRHLAELYVTGGLAATAAG